MNGELSPADVAVLSGNHNNGGGFGYGDSGAWWIIIFLIFALGGWGNNGNNGGFGGGFGGYPYFVGGYSDTQRGFDQSAIMSGINTINGNLADLATQACNNRFDVVNAINTTGFENRLGLNSLSSQLAQCCCDNRAATADLKYTVATENCADRQALNEGIRDIIASNTANTQAILDKLCQQEIDAKNDTIANLQREVLMKDLQASQIEQTATLRLGQEAEVDALYNRLSNCPVPTTPVYGRTPIFTCPNNNNYGCGCGNGNYSGNFI